jgi:hypothetical protein
VPYQDVVQGWHDFYMLAGTAAAALAGLLFVGLSLHLGLIVARSDVRMLARITLANFGLTLFLSLFVLIRQAPEALGTELIIGGVITLLTVVPSVVEMVRSQERTLSPYHLVLRFGLSFVACCGVITAGVLIRASGDTSGFDWLWIVTVALLAVSLRNSWELLVDVGMARRREADASGQRGGVAD